uniref:Coatomer subunit delta n=1 Tax=Globodera rostochiensis TaxID=31243 RepID=A0A914I6K4_GLORO
MVLIAASVFTKSGKALVTRQYVADMTRARLEGLLNAFPKLITSDKSQRQHTFVETNSVRYVYQPMDNIYIVLITTKASNILEDLETLRLFSRVIPEYCRCNEESEITDKAFDLIFAFDEIVVLGYRENVNLAQIRTFTEMDSHEERVFNQIQIAQQRAAHSLMKEKEKEIKRQEKLKKHLKGGIAGSATGISSAQARTELISAVKDSPGAAASSLALGTKKSAVPLAGGGKALKLGAKSANEDAFFQQLRNEGEKVLDKESSNVSKPLAGADSAVSDTDVKAGAVHFKCVEKINTVLSRGGGLYSSDSAKVQGSISLCVSDPKFNAVAIRVLNNIKQVPGCRDSDSQDNKGVQIQSLLRLKSEQKPYPVSVDVGVLKWSIKLADEDSLPLTLNCWPNESPDGVTVNIEYTLQREDMQLKNVQIVVPLPPATAPVISECEGSYEYLKSKGQLLWTIPLVDRSSKTGTLEFTTANGNADHFFPVQVNFSSTDSFSKIMVESVETMQGGEVEFTDEKNLFPEKFIPFLHFLQNTQQLGQQPIQSIYCELDTRSQSRRHPNLNWLC